MSALQMLRSEYAALVALHKAARYQRTPPKDPAGWEPPTAKRKTWKKADASESAATPHRTSTAPVTVVGTDPQHLRDYLDAVDHHSGHPTAEASFLSHDFGNKSEPRVRTLLSTMRKRTNVAPGSLEALTAWHKSGRMTPEDRRAVSHFHAALTDPLYQRFAQHLFTDRVTGQININAARNWVRDNVPEDVAPASRHKLASALLTAAKQVGLVDRKGNISALRLTPDALTYAVHLARAREEAPLNHSMLQSAGHDEESVRYRLRRTPDFNFRAMADLVELNPRHANLHDWAQSMSHA